MELRGQLGPDEAELGDGLLGRIQIERRGSWSCGVSKEARR
jgi:hypothetical protein